MAKQKTPPPHLAAAWEKADAAAIQALYRGDASPEQQKRALDWIISVACVNNELPWSEVGDRETNFFAGRQYAGRQIVKLLKLNLSVLKDKE